MYWKIEFSRLLLQYKKKILDTDYGVDKNNGKVEIFIDNIFRARNAINFLDANIKTICLNFFSSTTFWLFVLLIINSVRATLKRFQLHDLSITLQTTPTPTQ